MSLSQSEHQEGNNKSFWARKNKKAKQEKPGAPANSSMSPSISSVPSQSQRDRVSSPISQHSQDSRGWLRRKLPTDAPSNGRQTPASDKASHSHSHSHNNKDDEDDEKKKADAAIRLSSPTPDDNRPSILTRISRSLFRSSPKKLSRASEPVTAVASPARGTGASTPPPVRSPEREFRLWSRRSRRNTAPSSRAPSVGKTDGEDTEMSVLHDAAIESSHPTAALISTSIDEQITREVGDQAQDPKQEGQILTRRLSNKETNPENGISQSTGPLSAHIRTPAIVIPTSEITNIPRFRTPPYGTLRVTNEDAQPSPSADSQELLQRLQTQFDASEENRELGHHSMAKSRSTMSLKNTEQPNQQNGSDNRQVMLPEILKHEEGSLAAVHKNSMSNSAELFMTVPQPSILKEQQGHTKPELNGENGSAAAVSSDSNIHDARVTDNSGQLRGEDGTENDRRLPTSDSSKPFLEYPLSVESNVASISAAQFSPLYRSRTGSSRYSSRQHSIREPFMPTRGKKNDDDSIYSEHVKEAITRGNENDPSRAFAPLAVDSPYQDQSLDSAPTVDFPIEHPTIFKRVGSQSASLRLLDAVNLGSPFRELGLTNEPNDGTGEVSAGIASSNVKTSPLSSPTSPFLSSTFSEEDAREDASSLWSTYTSDQSPHTEMLLANDEDVNNGDTPNSIEGVLQHGRSMSVASNRDNGNGKGVRYDTLTPRQSLLSERLRKPDIEIPPFQNANRKDSLVGEPHRSFSPPLNFSRPNPVSSPATSTAGQSWEDRSTTFSPNRAFTESASGMDHSPTPSSKASFQYFQPASASQLRTRNSSTPTVVLPPKITPETVEVRSKITSRHSPATRALQESIFFAGNSRSRDHDADSATYDDGHLGSPMSSCSSSSIDSDEATERGTIRYRPRDGKRVQLGMPGVPSISMSPEEAVCGNNSGFMTAMSAEGKVHGGVREQGQQHQQQAARKPDRFTRIGSLDTAVADSSNSSTTTSTPTTTTINERIRSYLPFAFRGNGNTSGPDTTENDRYRSDSSGRDRYLPTPKATASTTAVGVVDRPAPENRRENAGEIREASSSGFSATPLNPASISSSWSSSSAAYHQDQGRGQGRRYDSPDVDGPAMFNLQQGYRGRQTPGQSSASNYTATSTEPNTRSLVSQPLVPAAQQPPLIAKIFVICHQCERFHDLPPAEYAALIMAEVADVEGGKGGSGEVHDETHLSTSTLTVPAATSIASPASSMSDAAPKTSRSGSAAAVEAPVCCWCSHRMTKGCCAGWTALVNLQQRTLTH